jgi:hypothetical protein
MRYAFAFGIIAAVAAVTALAALLSGDVSGSALAGFTFLVSGFSAFVGICLLFVIGGSDWAPRLARQAVPVAFGPLLLGGLLSLPAIQLAGTFHRPDLAWFSGSGIGLRAAAGCGAILLLAWLTARNPSRALVGPFAIVFVLFQTLFSWDFGMTLQPHWHDTIFAPLWIISSALAGVALLIVFCATQRTALQLRPQDFDRFGCFLLAFCLLHGYFIYAQTLTVWYGNLPEEVGALHARIAGDFAPLFWLVVAVTVPVPAVLLVFRPVRSSRGTLSAIAGAVLVALWLERLWLILPARYSVH